MALYHWQKTGVDTTDHPDSNTAIGPGATRRSVPRITQSPGGPRRRTRSGRLLLRRDGDAPPLAGHTLVRTLRPGRLLGYLWLQPARHPRTVGARRRHRRGRAAAATPRLHRTDPPQLPGHRALQ